MKICYILVNYLPHTMNPGKAMAQVHHAGVQMMAKIDEQGEHDDYLKQADGFGTTIVLQHKRKETVDVGNEIHDMIDGFQASTSGVVVDPTYPVDVNLTVSATTCGWILLDDEDHDDKIIIEEIKRDWKLHD